MTPKSAAWCALTWLAVALLAGCSASEPRVEIGAARATSHASNQVFGGGEAPQGPVLPHSGAVRPSAPNERNIVPTERQPRVAVSDPKVLAELERRGLGFAERLAALAARNAPASPAHDGAPRSHVTALPAAWSAVTEPLVRELAAIQRADPAAGVSVARFSHRLFDARWLHSPNAHVELVGVVSRLDRAPFHADSCGEVRLVYRLAYEATTRGSVVHSRLPMTLVLEYLGPPRSAGASLEETCGAAARAWQLEEDSPERQAEALLRGPLATSRLDAERLHQLAVNTQTVRWPSTVRPDLAGHAEYVLLAFAWDAAQTTFVPRPLENTPDVTRLRKSPALRGELVRWIGENLDAIDEGTARLPERFSATRARSVSPHGSARLENRPFQSALATELAALESLSLAEGERRVVRSVPGLLRRLDDLSCQGCHQSRSVAGFHWLGQDAESTALGNALVGAFSPHVEEELTRRAAFTHALAQGRPADVFRPPAERSSYAGYGARCGLGDTSFSDWGCDEGLRCAPYDAPRAERAWVGTCLPAEPSVGDPCEVGSVESTLDPRLDRARLTRTACGAGLVCNSNEVGFPGGMCTGECGDGHPDARCGPLAVLAPFNACLARGEPFPACLGEHVRLAGLRACSRSAPCRDDYICALADAQRPQEGVCLPPYFLFQLRVDGHSP